MEEEKQFSEKESLTSINRMIYEARGCYYETGLSALVYGMGHALAVMCGYIIPGYMANKEFKKIHGQQK